jgi:hypothetical protein
MIMQCLTASQCLVLARCSRRMRRCASSAVVWKCKGFKIHVIFNGQYHSPSTFMLKVIKNRKHTVEEKIYKHEQQPHTNTEQSLLYLYLPVRIAIITDGRPCVQTSFTALFQTTHLTSVHFDANWSALSRTEWHRFLQHHQARKLTDIVSEQPTLSLLDSLPLLCDLPQLSSLSTSLPSNVESSSLSPLVRASCLTRLSLRCDASMTTPLSLAWLGCCVRLRHFQLKFSLLFANELPTSCAQLLRRGGCLETLDLSWIRVLPKQASSMADEIVAMLPYLPHITVLKLAVDHVPALTQLSSLPSLIQLHLKPIHLPTTQDVCTALQRAPHLHIHIVGPLSIMQSTRWQKFSDQHELWDNLVGCRQYTRLHCVAPESPWSYNDM